VRTVVLHTDHIAGTPWQDWKDRPVTGLGVRRAVAGPLVVYRLA